MINSSYKFFSYSAAGIFGGSILGMIGFFQMIRLSAQNGRCAPLIDSLFNGAGYESCGSFGALSGIILGSIIGILIINKFTACQNIKTTVILLLGALFLPFLYNAIRFFPDSLKNKDIFIVLAVTLIFILFSIIPSMVFAFIVKKISTNRQSK